MGNKLGMQCLAAYSFATLRLESIPSRLQ
jgi:hypothetical protein